LRRGFLFGAETMSGGCRRSLILAVAIGQVAIPMARADGLLDRLKAGRHRQLKQEYHSKEFPCGPPYDLGQLASMVDIVEEGILDDGTVVIKRPDVWSPARMTKYRRDFEVEMQKELTRFAAVLSARVARTDQASFENATTLGAALAAGGRRGPAPIQTPQLVPGQAAGDFNTAQVDLLRAQTDAFKAQSDAQINLMKAEDDRAKTQAHIAESAAEQNIAQLAPAHGTSAEFAQSAPFKLLGQNGAFQNFADNVSGGKLGLEPTIYLDEKKRYLDHLNEIRRVNLGDDNADSAGYSLSLVRMPVSIQPGEKTKKGHGAILTMTARPEFAPDYLRTTFRNLVVHDLVDQLTPILYEILDRNLDQDFLREFERLTRQKLALDRELRDVSDRLDTYERALKELRSAPPRAANPEAIPPDVVQERLNRALGKRRTVLESLRENGQALQVLPQQTLDKAVFSKIPSSRLAARPYPIAPTDMRRVFLSKNLFLLANAIRRAQPTVTPRAAEVRAFLDQTSEPAFALLPSYVEMIEEITSAVRSRAYLSLPGLYARLADCLPNDLARNGDDPVTMLCWSIAVDAGLLDERLKSEMKRLVGQNGFNPSCDLDALSF
jgi:hypothetical protein